MKNFTIKLAVVCLVISTLVVGFLSIAFPEAISEQKVYQLSKLIFQVNLNNSFASIFDSLNKFWVGVDILSDILRWLLDGK